jgi:hypothetical protein
MLTSTKKWGEKDPKFLMELPRRQSKTRPNAQMHPLSIKLKDRCAQLTAVLALIPEWSQTKSAIAEVALCRTDKSPVCVRRLMVRKIFTKRRWHLARLVSRWLTWWLKTRRRLSLNISLTLPLSLWPLERLWIRCTPLRTSKKRLEVKIPSLNNL